MNDKKQETSASVKPSKEAEVKKAPEEKQEPINKQGVVIDCVSLYVRKTPDKSGAVETTIPKGTVVSIDESKSTNEFYKVKTQGKVSGFCMKTFIQVN